MLNRYQFSAIRAFPRGLTLCTRGFLRRVFLGMEDLFFFFWSSRPIFAIDSLLGGG